MATTPIYALVYPTTANQITPLATHFANLATSVETAMGTAQGRFIGTDSARTALAAPQRKEGAEFYTTDTKREWVYDGTTWVGVDRGLYVVYPTSVVNGSIQTDGTVIPTGGTTSVSFNGCFTSRFRKYRLEFTHATGGTGGNSVMWRNAGVDKADANFYSYAQTGASTGGGTISGGAASAFQSVALYAAGFHTGYIEFTNPQHTNTPKYINSWTWHAPQTGHSIVSGWSSNDNGTYDGFTFQQNGGSFPAGGFNRFKLYAYA